MTHKINTYNTVNDKTILRKHFHINLSARKRQQQTTHKIDDDVLFFQQIQRPFLYYILLFSENVQFFFHQKNFIKNKREKYKTSFFHKYICIFCNRILCFLLGFLFFISFFFCFIVEFFSEALSILYYVFFLCACVIYLFVVSKALTCVFVPKWCQKKSIFKLTFCENVTIFHDTIFNINTFFSIFSWGIFLKIYILS